MTIYKFLLQHKDITTTLIRAGLMPSRYASTIKIYLSYKECRDVIGLTKGRAVDYCVVFYQCSRQHGYNIINEMEKEL